MNNSETNGLDNFVVFNTISSLSVNKDKKGTTNYFEPSAEVMNSSNEGEEKRRINNLYPCSRDQISILVHNKISWGVGCGTKKGNPKKFKFEVPYSMTVWNLKNYIADKLRVDSLLLKVEKLGLTSRVFTESENSRSLYQLGIKNDDKFSISTKMSNSLLDHLSLMFSDSTLTPECDKMLSEVFQIHMNHDGFMDTQSAASFLKLCTNQNTEIDDPRVKRLFDNFNEKKDGKLTCEEFKNFYKEAIEKKEQTVWSNVRSWNYKTDLKQGTERPIRDPKTLLRFKIPEQGEYFDYFFEMLDDPNYEVAKSSWKFLTELCIHPIILEKVISLDIFDDDIEGGKWKKTENPFKLIYILKIIHFLLQHQLQSTTQVRVMFKDEEVKDKELEITGTGITKNNPSIPAPTPAVPISNSRSGKGKVTNVVSASSNNAPPPPPPDMPPQVPDLIDDADVDPKQVKFENENEKGKVEDGEYAVSVYPPGGKVVEVDEERNILPSEKEELLQKDKENKEEDSKNEEVNYTEEIKLPIYHIVEKYKDQIKDWVAKFIEKGGYDYICDLYLSQDSFISKKLVNISLMTDEEKTCSELLLDILGVFNIVAAYVKDPSIPKETPSKPELDTVKEDVEMEEENSKGGDDYHINEEDLLKNIKEMDPTRERTISVIAKEKNEEELVKAKIQLFKEINHAGFSSSITEDLAQRIIDKFDYETFVKRTLSTLNTVISSRSLTQIDKDIVSQNMNVAMNLFLYDERSLAVLYNFNDTDTKTDFKEFIIKGMTFSSDQEIKAIFMTAIMFTCQKIKHTKNERLPLMVILQVMKEHFLWSIKENTRYYGYKEFYSCFVSLIREYFRVQKSRNKKFENIIMPTIFLKQLIGILKEYKTKEKRNTVLEDHCLIGTFDILA